MTTDWLLDQEEVDDRKGKTRPPWSGLWYVNVGEGPHRAWQDMRKYGFISAGGGKPYSGRLQKLQPGDPFVMYLKQAGYVGYGKVVEPAVMARDFQTPSGPILDQTLQQPGLAWNRDDPILAEWLVRVEWIKTVPKEEARRADGLFTNPLVACKLTDAKTLEFLRGAFGVEAG